MDAKPAYLTAQDIASRLKITKRTLSRWRREGRFPGPDLTASQTQRWKPETIASWEREANERSEQPDR